MRGPVPKPLPETPELERLAREAAYSLARLRLLLGLSEWQMRRAFPKRFGCSPHQWLDTLRLAGAEIALDGRTPAKCASFTLGFKERHSFYRWFKSHEHITASQFRATLRPASPGPPSEASASIVAARDISQMSASH